MKSKATRTNVSQNELVQPQSSADRFWMTTRDVMERLNAPSTSAARCWLHRKGIVRNGYGRVSRFDVERALKIRSRRGRHPNSLANMNSARRSA